MRKLIIILLFGILGSLSACSGYHSTISARGALREEFTDNVRLSHDNPQAEVISTVTPGLSYGLKGKDKELNLNYDPSFVYNAAGQSDFSTRQSANLDMKSQISQRSRLLFTDTFLYTNDPATTLEPSFSRVPDVPPEDTTLRRSTNPFYTNTSNVRFHQDLGARDSFELGYAQRILSNEDPSMEDSTSNEPSLALTYWLASDYGFQANAAFTRGDFSKTTESFNEALTTLRLLRKFSHQLDGFLQYTNTSMNFEGERTNYLVHDGSVGFDYHISETTFCTLRGGYFYNDNEQENNPSGYVFSGDMAKTFQHGAIRLSGATGYQQTFFGAENLGFTKYYKTSLSGRYALAKRLTAEVAGSYTNNSYTDIANREDRVINTTASLAYVLNPWLSLSCSFSHRDFDSTTEGDTYSENRITFGLTLTRPHSFRFEH